MTIRGSSRSGCRCSTQRGARATGAESFPTRAQLDATDVLILHTQEAGNITSRRIAGTWPTSWRAAAGSSSSTPARSRTIRTGARASSAARGETGRPSGSRARWTSTSPTGDGPITKGASNFDGRRDLLRHGHPAGGRDAGRGLHAEACREGRSQKRADEDGGGKRATSTTSSRRCGPTSGPPRAAARLSRLRQHPRASLQELQSPHYRAILLRGIAWAGKRANVDESCSQGELGDNLHYLEGGPHATRKATAKIEIHPDFNMKLVAAEPLISKPMNFDWDPRGRLWVAETPEYPNGRRGCARTRQGVERHAASTPPGEQDARRRTSKSASSRTRTATA